LFSIKTIDDTDTKRRELAGRIVSNCLEKGEELQRILSQSTEEEDRRVDALEQQLASASLSSNSTSYPVNIPSSQQSNSGNQSSIRRSSLQSSSVRHSLTSDSFGGVTTSSPPMAMTPPPAWQRDEEADECGLCDKRFSLFIRRHHCRWCGKIFCDNCTSSRIPIPNTSSSSSTNSAASVQPEQRVCDTCHELLTSTSSPLHRLNVQTSDNSSQQGRQLATTIASSATTPGSISPNHEASPLESSIMNECPVCGEQLSMNQNEAEFHLNQCINQGVISAAAISGKRYVVTIVEPGSFSSSSNMRPTTSAATAGSAAAVVETAGMADISDDGSSLPTQSSSFENADGVGSSSSNSSRAVKFSSAIATTIETNEIPPYQPREGDLSASPHSDYSSGSRLHSPPPQSSFSDGGLIHECVIVRESGVCRSVAVQNFFLTTLLPFSSASKSFSLVNG
jgi:hypothetical protein